MADIVTSRVFNDGEIGITATKMNDIIASSVIQPAFVSAKPVASSTGAGDQLLLLKAAGTYAQIDSSVFASSMVPLLPDPNPNIWSQRLRSFNAVGNPTFEIDQRNVGALLTNPGSGAFLLDRWFLGKTGTMTVNTQQLSPAAGNEIVVPGTNFMITRNYLRFILTAQQVSLGATDTLNFQTLLEGSRLRELFKDVYSISILCRSSVANLKFGLALRDPPTTSKTLTKLCSLGAANTFTLIPLANWPVFPSGNFSVLPGVEGLRLVITLAAGSTVTAPANDTWQSGGFLGAVGQSNFAASPVSSTFDIAFIQHEPGAVCSTLMDCPFEQNYDACLRYFTKSYDYDVAVGSSTAQAGMIGLTPVSTVSVEGAVRYPKAMAKIPTIIGYNPVVGTVNSLRHSNGTDYAISSFTNIGKNGFEAINTATMAALALGQSVRIHYTADTGW